MREHKQEINVPITLINTPQSLVLFASDLPKVGVAIRATGLDIFKLKLSNNFFEIDASQFNAGENLVEITNRKFKYPKNINFDFEMITTEQTFLIELDKLVEAQKPLKISFESVKEEEYFTKYKIINKDEKVTVYGPKKLLSSIKNIETEKISRKMLDGNKIVAELILPDLEMKLKQKKIVLNIVQSKTINKTIALIPIVFPEDKNIAIIPQKVTLRIKGAQNIVDKISRKSIKANLDFTRIKDGYASVIFDVPMGIEILEYTPQKVQIIEND
ncbi:MAG: hypothetical protein HN334_05540 [Candidatus Cloacimonetes bacterium]|nr:hypothetical protein [Candidatus Cloacimonadota bacterium]MBT7468820.1 hypothetical protein [Candidatus Cloacimonadota bacterium]